jgi:nucleoside-diphosphate-sugar epimerase
MIGGARGKVLVTGAGGGMGMHLVRRLLETGRRVRGLILPGDPARAHLEDLGCEVHEGDVSLPGTIGRICDGVDLVYHLAAVIISHDPAVFRRVNHQGTGHVVALAAAARVRHFVYVSSASVTYPRRTPYAESKLAAEKNVREERSFEYTIVRPTLAYDEKGGLELTIFLRYLQRFPVVPFIGSGEAIKRPVWAHDIATGLLSLAGNPLSYGRTYNFSGGEAISILDLARLLLAHHGGSRPFLHLPVPLCRAGATLMGALMSRPPLTHSAIAGIVHDADLDPTDAIRDLGYRPLGVREGFQRCFPILPPEHVPVGGDRHSVRPIGEPQ